MPDTKISALAAADAALAAHEYAVNEGGANKKVTGLQLKNFISKETLDTVGGTQSNNTVTPASVADLEQVLAPGTYLVKYWIVYQASATTTGVEFFVDHTGTVTRCVGTWYTLTTGGAAATGIADQATTLTAQMMEGKGFRAKNTASGPTQGVDSANADQLAILEAVLIVTGSGTLRLMFRSEVAASAIVIQPGTSVTITQVA